MTPTDPVPSETMNLGSSVRWYSPRLDKRTVHGIAKSFVQSDAIERHQLHEQHGGELVHGVDPKQRARGAVPKELANDAVVLVRVGRRTRAHREVDPKSHPPFARQPLAIRDTVRQMARRHEPHGFWLENSHTVERTAVQQHPRETQV